mgnify:CR=1 FL=1
MVNSAAFEKNIIEHKHARKVFDPDVIKIMNDTLMMMPVDLSIIKEAADLRKIKPFSMNKVWDDLIKNKKLIGVASRQKFFHINNYKIYKKLNKKIID